MLRFRVINNFFRNSLLLALVWSMLGSMVLFPNSVKAEMGEGQWYVAQLGGTSTDALTYVSKDITQLFEGSTAPLLSNTYRFLSTKSLLEIKQAFKGGAKFVEVDRKIATAEIILNDPWFTENPLDTDRQWSLAKAGFIEAWEKNTGSNSDIIAIIDTGVDATHEDLRGAQYVTGYDFVTRQEITPGTNSDDNGHGTLIAGIIAATPNNGLGIAGIHWRAALMPVKTLDAKGEGSASFTAEAIVWAADHGAAIINLSLAGLGFVQEAVLSNAIHYAFDKNVVIVAAAGNDSVNSGRNLDANPTFPVCDDNGENMVIGVTAVDASDTKPAFANFGKNCIDVSAPGKRIISTINRDPITHNYSPNSYAYTSGTSLAVPFVTAQAALLKALNPQASNKQIRDQIITTTDNIDGNNLSQCNGTCAGLLGSGRINALRSMSQQIQITQIREGDVVQDEAGKLYLISGGKKKPLSAFVRAQRFPNLQPKLVARDALNSFAEGSFAEPLDGTLVKSPIDQTVYQISLGVRLPVTAQVFAMRGFRFASIVTLDPLEVSSWIVGSFLAPPEGALVKTARKATVYWVVGGSLHPVSFRFFTTRGLSVFPIVEINEADLTGFSKGESYF